MSWIFLILLFVVFGIILHVVANVKYSEGNKHKDWRQNAVLMYVIAGILLLICVVKTLNARANQINDNESLTQITQSREVLQKRAEFLTKEFADCLIEKYPKYEKSIFETIKPDKVSFYVVKFPEIRTIETIMTYVYQVKEINDKCYAKDLERIDLLKDMRYRAKSPWIFQWAMPDIKIPEK